MAMNFYAVLGVARTATEEEIRRRFRELARERHPDRFGESEKAAAERDFQELTQAFNVLIDPERRRAHDAGLVSVGGGARSGPGASSAPGAGASEDHGQLVKAILAQGVREYKARDYAAAAESFQRATRVDAASPQAWYNLALTESRRAGRSGPARAAIERACQLEPRRPAYLKLAGRLYAEAGMSERARRCFDEALTWGGPDPEIDRSLEQLDAGGRSRGLFGKAR